MYLEFVILIITATPGDKFYYFHFTDEKSELRIAPSHPTSN